MEQGWLGSAEPIRHAINSLRVEHRKQIVIDHQRKDSRV
jgi:hypothetical protein